MASACSTVAARDAAAAGTTGFDPVAGVFVAQTAAPPGVSPIEPSRLSPLQRALLVIDGTVTKFLEAWELEPVRVVRLDQQPLALASAEPALDLTTGAPVIRRQVILQGERSGKFLAWADSLIASGRLPAVMGEALDHDNGGLGRILLDSRIETRRECLWFGRDRPAGVPAPVAGLWQGEFLVRAYRVIAAGRPIMLITERFPL
jgi:chorismate-pyruvate lyase